MTSTKQVLGNTNQVETKFSLQNKIADLLTKLAIFAIYLL